MSVTRIFVELAELYIDLQQQTYHDLGFQRTGLCNCLAALLGKRGREILYSVSIKISEAARLKADWLPSLPFLQKMFRSMDGLAAAMLTNTLVLTGHWISLSSFGGDL